MYANTKSFHAKWLQVWAHFSYQPESRSMSVFSDTAANAAAPVLIFFRFFFFHISVFDAFYSYLRAILFLKHTEI